MIRIRSEFVKYFFLRRRSVGVLPECNFPPYTAEPHIASIAEEGWMGLQFGVHVLADLVLLSHAGKWTLVLMMRHGANTQMHMTRSSAAGSSFRRVRRGNILY